MSVKRIYKVSLEDGSSIESEAINGKLSLVVVGKGEARDSIGVARIFFAPDELSEFLKTMRGQSRSLRLTGRPRNKKPAADLPSEAPITP